MSPICWSRWTTASLRATAWRRRTPSASPYWSPTTTCPATRCRTPPASSIPTSPAAASPRRIWRGWALCSTCCWHCAQSCASAAPMPTRPRRICAPCSTSSRSARWPTRQARRQQPHPGCPGAGAHARGQGLRRRQRAVPRRRARPNACHRVRPRLHARSAIERRRPHRRHGARHRMSTGRRPCHCAATGATARHAQPRAARRRGRYAGGGARHPRHLQPDRQPQPHRVSARLARRRDRHPGVAPEGQIPPPHPRLRSQRDRGTQGFRPLHPRPAFARCARPDRQAPPWPDRQVRRSRHGRRAQHSRRAPCGVQHSIRGRGARTDRPCRSRWQNRNRRRTGPRRATLRTRRAVRPCGLGTGLSRTAVHRHLRCRGTARRRRKAPATQAGPRGDLIRCHAVLPGRPAARSHPCRLCADAERIQWAAVIATQAAALGARRLISLPSDTPTAMPPITLILILLNVLVYVLELVTGPEINRIFALWPPGSDGTFHLWQLVTYSFLHGSLTHLGFNMFAVWMFGAELERRWNDLRYLLTYLLSVVVATMTQIAVSGYFRRGGGPGGGAAGGGGGRRRA